MRFLMFLVLILPTLLFAQTVDLQKHYVPALSQVLFDDNRRAITLVETPEIKDNAGNLARGVHTIHFSLDVSSPFPVVVEGRTVQPGETYVFTHNLSNSGHRLSLPIHPATAFVSGAAEYTLSLPSLFIEMCPAGFTKGDVDCYRIDFAEPIVECPSGFTVLSGQCSKTITMSKTFACASGYTRSGDTCLINTSTPVDKICPATHFMNPAGRCELVESSKPLRCELGFEVDGTQCVKRETQPITEAGCPDGFSEAFGQCEKVTYQLQGNYCANVRMGTTPNCTGSGITQVCNAYNETLGSCDKSTFAPVVSVCPTGTVLTGANCVFMDNYDIEASCPEGYTRTNGSCSKYEIKPANKSCPAGYTMSGTTCSKIENQSIVSCPTGYAKVGSTCHVTTPINISCPTAGYSWNGSNCAKTESQSATPICPTNSTWNGTQCNGVVIEDPTPSVIYYCQHGSLNGNKCHYSQSMTCPSGASPTYTMPGWCITINNTSVPEIMGCAPGFMAPGELLPDGSCRRNASKLNSYKCNTGFTYNSGKHQCTKSIQSSPSSYSCPTGWSRSASTCNRTLTQSENRTCTSNYSVLNTSTCRANAASNNVGNCNSGFTVSGTTCTRTLTQTVNYLCDTTWSIKDTSSCERTLTELAAINCPVGFIDSGGTCYETQTTPGAKKCPNPYVRVDDGELCRSEIRIPFL